MGGVKPHRKGIQVTFHWNGERHRPTIKIPPTAANLKYATRLKGEIELAIGKGEFTLDDYARYFPNSQIAKAIPKSATKPTFGEVARDWLKTSSHLSAGTLIKYKQALSFWLGHLEDMPIDQIKLSTIAALANSQGWGPKNRNNILIPLRRVMDLAYQDQIIDSNPAERIKNAKVQSEPPDPLTIEEVELVLNHMNKYHPQIRNFFEFAFFTGMRPSELISLQWGDIDHVRQLARVQRARTFGSEHETKTYKVRDIELIDRAMGAISRQKQYTLLKGAYVFENPVTELSYTEERPLRRAYWNPTLKALGMRQRNFYQTRHTYATLNLMAGANPMWVAKQLGHSTMAMLLTVYSKWIDGADKSKESKKLADILNQNATSMPPKSQINS